MNKQKKLRCVLCNNEFICEHIFVDLFEGQTLKVPHCSKCFYDKGECADKHGYQCGDCSNNPNLLSTSSPSLLSQKIEEWVQKHCQCGEEYTDRKLTAPYCPTHNLDESGFIEELALSIVQQAQREVLDTVLHNITTEIGWGRIGFSHGPKIKTAVYLEDIERIVWELNPSLKNTV